jgi:hypothetical protein
VNLFISLQTLKFKRLDINENEFQNNDNFKRNMSINIKEKNQVKLIDKPIQIFYEHNYIPFEILIAESGRLKSENEKKYQTKTQRTNKSKRKAIKGLLKNKKYLSNSFSFLKNPIKISSITKRSMSLSALDKFISDKVNDSKM